MKRRRLWSGKTCPFERDQQSPAVKATNPFTTIQREDVGLNARVTPHINSDNLVRLLIHQECLRLTPRAYPALGHKRQQI